MHFCPSAGWLHFSPLYVKDLRLQVSFLRLSACKARASCLSCYAAARNDSPLLSSSANAWMMGERAGRQDCVQALRDTHQIRSEVLELHREFVCNHKWLDSGRLCVHLRDSGAPINSQLKTIYGEIDDDCVCTCRNRTPPEIMRKSMEDLTEFANMGHRVMLVCQRQLTPQECNTYLERVGVLHP